MKPEQLLELARAVYPDSMLINNMTGKVFIKHDENTRTFEFAIDDATMYPLWRKYADDYESYLCDKYYKGVVNTATVEMVLGKVIEASKSPEGIAEALYQMLVGK